MKLKAWALGLLIAAPALGQAQTVSYSLPQTTVTVEVEAVQESFFAGPYASFAKKYLGIDVRSRDASRSYLKEVRLVTRVEADPAARYTIDIKGAEDKFLVLSSQGLVSFQDKLEGSDLVWRFNPQPEADFGTKGVTSQTRTEIRTTWQEVQTDTSFIRVPVEEAFQVEKTTEMKAKEAAELILRARKERFNISTGNTDATFSGEALGAALAELDRVEKEYLTLFTGYTVEREQKGSFDVVPTDAVKKQQYIAFRLSDREGLEADGVGTPYLLEFEPAEVSEGVPSARESKNSIHYRIPAVCSVKLVSGGRTLFVSRFPVYQLGREAHFPLK
jgi:hypothetical protein